MKHSQVLIIAIAFTLNATALHAADTNKWESSAAAGLSLTRGNSETLLMTLDLKSTRKTATDEILLGATATYGENTDQDTDKTETTAQSLAAFAQYNHSLNERWYVGARADFLHDELADLKYRVTVGPHVGYYAIKQPETTLKFEAGPSGVFERQGDEDNQYAALRLSERFEHKFSPRAKMWQGVDFIPQIDLWHNYLIIAEIGAEASLTERLSLRGVIQDYYDNDPAEGKKNNDLKLITSLVYKF